MNERCALKQAGLKEMCSTRVLNTLKKAPEYLIKLKH